MPRKSTKVKASTPKLQKNATPVVDHRVSLADPVKAESPNTLILNVNNESNAEVTVDSIESFVDALREKLASNSEHLYLSYVNKDEVNVDIKFLRTEAPDELIVAQVREWLKAGLES